MLFRSLALALEVFWRQGWRSTSMADLAQATGVQRGSLYNAYGGKKVLFLLAFEQYADRFLGEARDALDAPGAHGALSRFFEVVIANMTVGSPPRGCLTTKTVADADGAGPEVQGKLRGLLDELGVLVGAALSRAAVREGLVLAPDEAAQVVVTFTRGLAVMERVYRDPAALRRAAAALVRALVKDGAP